MPPSKPPTWRATSCCGCEDPAYYTAALGRWWRRQQAAERGTPGRRTILRTWRRLIWLPEPGSGALKGSRGPRARQVTTRQDQTEPRSDDGRRSSPDAFGRREVLVRIGRARRPPRNRDGWSRTSNPRRRSRDDSDVSCRGAGQRWELQRPEDLVAPLSESIGPKLVRPNDRELCRTHVRPRP